MQKRSRKKKVDLNELAAIVVSEAVSTEPVANEEVPVDSEKNPAAVAMGKLGGPKGGKNRWKGVSKEKRSEVARKAALARWKKKKPE